MHSLRLAFLVKLIVATVAALPLMAAHAGADLAAVQARGVLRCGVSGDIPGFAERDAAGSWQGMEVDFCRAVAAATLGNPEKVQFVPLKASDRFPALQAKKIDLLMRNTTWTLAREALLKLQFPAVLFYDGQGFMVRKSARIDSADKLKSTKICVEKGTTHEARLLDYFGQNSPTEHVVVIDSAREVAAAFFAGRCQAYSSDASQLAAVRARAPDGLKDFDILPERISKEPMGPVVRGGDAEWATLVRWVLHMLIAAEEQGITGDNIDTRLQELAISERARRLVSGHDEWVARTLGVRADWANRAIKAGGNYGEIYERNLGNASTLKIDRGYNRLWQQGGLHYAPPLF